MLFSTTEHQLHFRGASAWVHAECVQKNFFGAFRFLEHAGGVRLSLVLAVGSLDILYNFPFNIFGIYLNGKLIL